MKLKGNKFHARRAQLDGYWFDSQAEARRYGELKLLEKAGVIRDLIIHPSFELLALVKEPHCRPWPNPVGKYVADFQYRGYTGRFVIEDVKSRPTRTAVYLLKKKIVKANYGIDIIEVE